MAVSDGAFEKAQDTTPIYISSPSMDHSLHAQCSLLHTATVEFVRWPKIPNSNNPSTSSFQQHDSAER
jgi:hypothetical protein